MTDPTTTPEPFPIWVVWREDEPIYGHFATEEAAKRATIDCWEEDEPVCPDYGWRPDGPRLELLVGGERAGVYVSRRLVYGAPAVVPPAGRVGLRDLIADVLADADGHRWVPGYDRRQSPAYQQYQARADKVLAALPTTDQAAARAAALREVADFYERVLEQSLDLGSDPRYFTAVRDVVLGLRRRAAETQQDGAQEAPPVEPHPTPADLDAALTILDSVHGQDTTAPAAEAQQADTAPVKETTRRYAEQLRATPGTVVADGHTGWECNAGASLIVEASTPGPGKLGTHHGVIYACAAHRAAAVEGITSGGYEVDPRPAPPGHRWNPWPCGHVTAYGADALAALTATGAQQDGGTQ